MRWDIEAMQQAIAPMTRSGAIGWFSRRPGNIERQIARVRHLPNGSPPSNYADAVDDMAAYGAYIQAFANAIRDKE